jgi:hypothetical protein
MIPAHPSRSALSTPLITSSRISAQLTTRHRLRGEWGRRLRERRRVGRLRGRLTSSVRQSLRTLVIQPSAPAPGSQSTWDSALGAIEDIISQCPFLQMTYTAENPHADDSAAPGARPRFARPATSTFTTRPALMMQPFICSYRNKNEPTAIYPSFGYSPTRKRKEENVMMLPPLP